MISCRSEPPEKIMELEGSLSMFKRKRGIPRSLLFMLAGIVLSLFLAACGPGGSSGSTSTPTPTPTPKPSPTPSMLVYNGNGFTISYPQGWKVTHQSNGSVQFADSLQIDNLVVTTTNNPGGVASADKVADASTAALKPSLKNSKTENVPPTTTVAGDTWSQRSASGDTTVNGQNTTVKFVVLVDNHPAKSASTKTYFILYGTSKSLFDSATTTYFQPMLQSFKFL